MMKIATLLVLSLFTAVVGLPPIAIANQIDIEKIDKHFDKHKSDSDYEKKNKDNKKYEGTSEKVKNGGPGTKGSTLIQTTQIQNNSVQSVPEPGALLLFGVGFVMLVGLHAWHRRAHSVIDTRT